MDVVKDVYSERCAALNSLHFLLMVELHINIPKCCKRPAATNKDLTMLSNDRARADLCNSFINSLSASPALTDVESLAENVRSSMVHAVATLPDRCAKPQHPRISIHTISLIERRNEARERGIYHVERELNECIKRSAKYDRKHWLNSCLNNGEWHAVKSLRAGFKLKQGRLRSSDGVLVDSSARVETMAQYLEDVQWAAKILDCPPPMEPLFDTQLFLPITPFTHVELRKVISHLQDGKAAGCDDIPPEVWRALASNDESLSALLDLCNTCWLSKAVPETWRHSTVITLFKKGDTSLPSNYRPISLLTIGYKVIAALLVVSRNDCKTLSLGLGNNGGQAMLCL